ncbi:hypothetical protein [Pseudooceanicola atlanticus]|uniref:Uncharacterized protein n=1 Tax=Pseudooceanicola atlanticus TaxID=1461694 RepID=A0A0A0EK36_9RHOB|nr:hypothetical protein [Pseudooceanicola atlanticus]KGM50665.1 hypothetical protein ATO9_04125 [Pseudooceanicola atlanticus]
MTNNSIGTSLYIATAAPATNDKAGYEALTWVQVNGLIQGFQFGISHAMIDIPDLLTGFTTAVKGAATGTDSQAQFRQVPSDTGQGTVLAQANDNDGIVSIKMGVGSGTGGALAEGDPVVYAQGVLHSYLPNQPTTTSFEGFSASFRTNDFAVIDVEPAA